MNLMKALNRDFTNCACLNRSYNCNMIRVFYRGEWFQGYVNLGSKLYARRVTRAVLRAYEDGALVLVETRRGTQKRRVVQARDGACYLRTIAS